MLHLYAIFHLNMAYSSIEESQRAEVVERCYWPLLRLAKQYGPIAIEASGYTLEVIEAIDPSWIKEFRSLISCKRCELVGCGYAQLIGPLVPVEVNEHNLRLGNEVYERFLGVSPKVALVNEQAYSQGLVGNYIRAGYDAIIMEWENATKYHPDWDGEWRYFPQYAVNESGEKIPVIWNHCIPFQKFQRIAHGDLEISQFIEYLLQQAGEGNRAFSIYGNDAEVFNFRPGRYHTEVKNTRDEWQIIEMFFAKLAQIPSVQLIAPSDVLAMMGESRAGRLLRLESPEAPIPVKKQGKYNVTRWAVTGRDDLSINTYCWRAFAGLSARGEIDKGDWKELCYLWSSDFRTHITEQRWEAYLSQLKKFTAKIELHTCEPEVAQSMGQPEVRLPDGISLHRHNHFLTIDSDKIKVTLNCRRGLAIDKLWFKEVSSSPLCVTLPHGYFDDISFAADYYSGHLVFEQPARPKITDLCLVDPVVHWDGLAAALHISCVIDTPLGKIEKTITVLLNEGTIGVKFALYWPEIPIGMLRLGAITLNPEGFSPDTLFFRTHNGGQEPETFRVVDTNFDHGAAVSSLISANQGVSMTKGYVEMGDKKKSVVVFIGACSSALLGLVSFRQVEPSYFFRAMFSGREIDETSRPVNYAHNALIYPLVFNFRLQGRLKGVMA